VLIIALFVSFISLGGGAVSTFAGQEDGHHKEKIQTPGEKPLPKHKGGKKHNHKKKHKRNKHKHKHKHKRKK
jgi:hypothetical protein